jgi:hypothetical protein
MRFVSSLHKPSFRRTEQDHLSICILLKQEIKLQAGESTILFDFLLLYQERLSRERDGQLP